MNYLKLTLLFLFYASVSFSQEKQERIFYIVDSIPVIEDPDEADVLTEADIDKLEVVTNMEKIRVLGYEGKADKLLFVTTKAYTARPKAIKRISTTKNMVKTQGLWYLKNSDQPYNGKFIDYFMNGKIQGEGTLKDGRIDGVRTVYYPNGNKHYFYTYSNGIENGASETYFINGKLMQKGSFVDKKEDGVWQEYYSTGKLKRESSFVANKQVLSKDVSKFHALFSKGITAMREGEYEAAIKKLDEAIKLNAAYADVYFYRGTAKLNTFNFDESIADFNLALALEPLYMEAVSNRAFARLRKYEFKDARTLSKSNDVTVWAAKDKVPIPKEDLDQICADLQLGYELGDRKPVIIDAMKRYCNTEK